MDHMDLFILITLNLLVYMQHNIMVTILYQWTLQVQLVARSILISTDSVTVTVTVAVDVS